MAAPLLSKKDKRKSLSGQKFKKNIPKNVLSAPNKIKIRIPEVTEEDMNKIRSLLNSLLPSARVPCNRDSNKLAKKNINHGCKGGDMPIPDYLLKRSQLLLGINVVSKAVSNGTASCVLFADDISPQLLIVHIIMICVMKKIPYMFFPDLRTLTNNCLGFPCIALGIKNSSSDFSPLIDQLKSSIPDKHKNRVKIEEKKSVESEVLNEVFVDLSKEKLTETFSYLYRDSPNKRVFIPDPGNKSMQCEENLNFIGFRTEEGKVDVEMSIDSCSSCSTVSGEIDEGQSLYAEKKLLKRKNAGEKKVYCKNKKKFGRSRFLAPKIMKMKANANREKKKFRKMKALQESEC